MVGGLIAVVVGTAALVGVVVAASWAAGTVYAVPFALLVACIGVIVVALEGGE